MKILFLDIDGVLLPGAWLMQYRDPRYIQPAKVELLNQICAATDCQVVVSSTWRMDSNCRDLLIEAGFNGKFHEHWSTPSFDLANESGLYVAKTRDYEIQHWVDEHQPTKYVAIDDMPVALKDQSLLIATDFHIGLTLMHVKQAILILNEGDT